MARLITDAERRRQRQIRVAIPYSKPGDDNKPSSPEKLSCPKSTVTVVPVGASPVQVTASEHTNILAQLLETRDKLPESLAKEVIITLYSHEENVKETGNIVIRSPDPDPAVAGGVNDRRMGVTEGSGYCPTCNMQRGDCPGHFGRVEFQSPVYYPTGLRTISQVLNSMCQGCGELLLSDEDFEKYDLNRYTGRAKLAEVEKHSRNKRCPRSMAPNKDPSIKPCSVNPEFSVPANKDVFQIHFRYSKAEGAATPYPINKAYAALSQLSVKSARKLGFDQGSHPRNLIMRSIMVTPPGTRNPYVNEAKVYVHPITRFYQELVRKNNLIGVKPVRPGEKVITDEDITRLIASMITSSAEKSPQGKPNKNFKAIIQGKKGVIRSSIMGRRGDYSARTVIIPDPSLRFGQISVPRTMARTLTQEERVCAYNQKALQQLWDQGKIVSIRYAKGRGMSAYGPAVKYYRLQLEDRVEREARDGDLIVANRQPTLHRQGMMAAEIVLVPRQAIGLHPSYVTPWGADFDGDEMALYGLRSLGSIAEAQELMHVKACLRNGQANKMMMGAIFDTVIGAYLLTFDGVMVRKTFFWDQMTVVTSRRQLASLTERLAKYSVPPYSGKALFSMLLPEDLVYTRGQVVIKEGVLIRGPITAEHISAKGGTISEAIWKSEDGEDRVVEFITDLTWVMTNWIAQRGYSIGIEDCMLADPDLRTTLDAAMTRLRLEASTILPGVQDPLLQEYQEKQIISKIDTFQNLVQAEVEKRLPQDNNMRLAVKSGAKGSMTNMVFSTVMVGQTYAEGHRRIPTNVQGGRCIPYFEEGSEELEARGFCPHSYLEGQTLTEFYFSAATARVGLVDQALQTSKSGQAHHLLGKYVENITVAGDGSVRNVVNRQIEPVYGGDGFNPEALVVVRTPFGTFPNFIDLAATVNAINTRLGF